MDEPSISIGNYPTIDSPRIENSIADNSTINSIDVRYKPIPTSIPIYGTRVIENNSNISTNDQRNALYEQNSLINSIKVFIGTYPTVVMVFIFIQSIIIVALIIIFVAMYRKKSEQ